MVKTIDAFVLFFKIVVPFIKRRWSTPPALIDYEIKTNTLRWSEAIEDILLYSVLLSLSFFTQ
jgi:hypothetical protein